MFADWYPKYKAFTVEIIDSLIGLQAVSSVSDGGTLRENNSLALELMRVSEWSGERCQLVLRADTAWFVARLFRKEARKRRHQLKVVKSWMQW